MSPTTVRRADYLVLVLTILAALPYELGPIATLVPASLKPWVAIMGLIAKLILSEIKTLQTPKKDE